MNRKMILYVGSGIAFFVILWIWLNFVLVGEEFSSAFITSVFASLFFSFIVYLVLKFVFLQMDKKFAEENKEESRMAAAKFFVKQRAADGSFYTSPPKTKESFPMKAFGLFFLFLTGLVAVYYSFIFYTASSILPGGIVWLAIWPILAVAWALWKKAQIDKEPEQEEGTSFKLFKDKVVLLPQNKVLRFDELDYIELVSYEPSADVIFACKEKPISFHCRGSGVGGHLIHFLECLGFERASKISLRSRRYVYKGPPSRDYFEFSGD
ncbi:hypothetical protein HY991_04500 [Candidatus Micrarchaeota archaeon]|nr:hypothetical protein [Candidatus Micrarchaeota archaeon]